MEKLIQFSLTNRVLILLVAVGVTIGGYFSFTKLSLDAFPDVTPVLVQVFTITDGLAPEEIERYVTFPIENAMNGLPNLKNIRSISNFGLSVINIYFDDDTDIYFARQLISERILLAKEGIPEGYGEPQMGPITTGMGQILFYYVTDDYNKHTVNELREIQDWIIKYNLQTVEGVTEVLSIGGMVKQFHININPMKLLQYNIPLKDVLEKVENNNSNVGAQFIKKNDEEYVVRSVGLAEGIEDIKKIVISSNDGVPIYLHQIADITIGGESVRGLSTKNGTGETVVGMVLKLIGTNTSEVIKNVKLELEKINKILPEGVRTVSYYDQEDLVTKCLNTVKDSLFQGIILVTVILFLFMGGIRSSFVVASSIPFSILFSFIFMNYFGISANLMSLGGLAIAIGMMVDGTIVIVENIDRLLLENPKLPKMQLIRKASGEVATPITFAIIIIVVVFLPLFTLQGVEGKTFRPLAYTVALAMIGSLIYAIAISPVITYFLMKDKSKDQQNTKSSKNFIIDKLEKAYRPVVTFFVKNRYLALILSVVVFFSGLATIPFLGSEFVPKLNEGDLLVRITMSPSISLDESKKIVTIFEKRILNQYSEVKEVVSRIGRGEVGAHADPVNSAEVFVSLKPQDEWKSAQTPEELYSSMSHYFENFPGAKFNFTQPIAAAVDELLTGTKAELAIKLFGEDMEILKTKAKAIEGVIGSIEGAQDIQTDQVSGTPQLNIKINRAKIARFGVNVSDIQELIKTAIGGVLVGQIFEGVKRFDIQVRYGYEHRKNKEAIKNILVRVNDKLKIPLSDLADIEEIVGPRQISRELGQRFITIQTNVRGIDIGTFVEIAKKAIAKDVDLPTGYFLKWGGQFQLQEEANKRLVVVIPITILFVLLMLYLNFSSFSSTFLIMLIIPLSLVGGAVSLWVSGQNLSVPASVGFIALFGIALENGMVLVTYLNELVRKGVGLDKACIDGAVQRLRPVIMTALTTGLGLVPLLLSAGTGSEVQRPLATVVLGGLFTSTFLTLIVLPSLYKWFSIKREK